MTIGGLVLRNLARNKLRATLTVAAVAITVLAFLFLRTVTWAWNFGATFAAQDRIVTRHRVTFSMSLPERYVQDVRNAPHIKMATWVNWFGGKDPNHDREFFNTLAVDPTTYFDVFDEMRVPAEQLERWRHDKQGAIVGDSLARKFGWKVGDRLALKSGLYPGDWQFTIDGIYTTTAKSVDRSTMLFPWSYLNDSIAEKRRDRVGWIVSRVDDPTRIASIGLQVDALFDDREIQTLSQDERSFNSQFLAMFSAILKAIDLISVVILAIMMLIVGNTIAMGARERTCEYGVLRAIGFLPHHVAFWVTAESVVLGVLGGVLGVGLAWPLINLLVSRVVEENVGAIFPYFRLETANMLLGLGLATVISGAAAAGPSWRASRLRVIDAIRHVA